MGIFYACDGIYRGSTTIYLVHPEMRNLPLVNWPMILVIAINDVGDTTKKRRYNQQTSRVRIQTESGFI